MERNIVGMLDTLRHDGITPADADDLTGGIWSNEPACECGCIEVCECGIECYIPEEPTVSPWVRRALDKQLPIKVY